MQLHHADIIRKPQRQISRLKLQSTPLNARLTGSHRCEALGVVASGHAPVLALCRELLAAGIEPDTALVVYRRGVLALKVRAIGKAAQLAVEDSASGRPRFRLARPKRRGAASPMRKNGGRVP
jgi:hypothetical protein